MMRVSRLLQRPKIQTLSWIYVILIRDALVTRLKVFLRSQKNLLKRKLQLTKEGMVHHMSHNVLIFVTSQPKSRQKLPKDTPIPSEATVLYSFSPPNMFSKSSQYYTGKINLKHAIQRRLLRSFHADSHYCNALFRYMREMAIQHKENCLFVSCNDKAKVDYGEPGTALSTGVRVKK